VLNHLHVLVHKDKDIKDICGHMNGTAVNKVDTICGRTFEHQTKNKQEMTKGGHWQKMTSIYLVNFWSSLEKKVARCGIRGMWLELWLRLRLPTNLQNFKGQVQSTYDGNDTEMGRLERGTEP